MSPRVTFPNKLLPYLLVAPQLAITLVFFYWPAIQAVYQSMLREDPFGLQTQFVWFRNFERVLSEPNYINSMQVTAIFSVATAFISMGVALVYLGEHYVTDLLAGAALVAVVRRGEPLAEPLVHGVNRGLRRLERLANG